MSVSLRKLYKTYTKKIQERNLENITKKAKIKFNAQLPGDMDEATVTKLANETGFQMQSYEKIFGSYKKALNKSLRSGGDQGFYRAKDGRSDLVIQGEKPLTFKEWKNRPPAKSLELPEIPSPNMELITAKKKEGSGFTTSQPKYGLSREDNTENVEGSPSNFDMWFKQQTIGETAYYPGDSKVPPGEFIIEYGGGVQPGLPPSQHLTQDFIFTKDGQKIDMTQLSPEMQNRLWENVREEYIRSAPPTDLVKMFLQENPNGNYSDFITYTKEAEDATLRNEELARNKVGESNLFYGKRVYDSEGKIIKDELKKQ